MERLGPLLLLLLLLQVGCWPPSAFITGQSCQFASWHQGTTCSRPA
jgi:hypothetical protein